MTHVDHVIGDLSGGKAVLALHSEAAKAKAGFDENTPLTAVIASFDEGGTRIGDGQFGACDEEG